MPGWRHRLLSFSFEWLVEGERPDGYYCALALKINEYHDDIKCGSVPDRRYASADTHEAWQGLVIGGAKRASGIPPADLTTEEAEAIQGFVISEARKLTTE